MSKTKKLETKLGANEAFCMGCRQRTEIINPREEARGEHGNKLSLCGTCSHCGRSVLRGIGSKTVFNRSNKFYNDRKRDKKVAERRRELLDTIQPIQVAYIQNE